MIFKSKIFLANCDSVRKLPYDEIKKRFLLGLSLYKGVIISPNIILDNKYFKNVLLNKNIIKYLNERGRYSFIIRGNNLKNINSLQEYFEQLPNNFKISFFNGKKKSDLSKYELKEYLDHIKEIDNILYEIKYNKFENKILEKYSLTKEIHKRVKYLQISEKIKENILSENSLTSRSEWYEYVEKTFPRHQLLLKKILIDPSYNYNYINNNELFAVDDIKYLSNIPEVILNFTITYKSFEEEIKLLRLFYKIFCVVSSHGIYSIVNLLKNEIKEILQDKILSEITGKISTTKTWLTFYKKIYNRIGVEIKYEHYNWIFK